VSVAAPGLEFEGLLRRPGGFVLDARFHAPPGVTALFGPSGSGKSTVLAIVSGLLRPDSGRVRVGGSVLLDTERGICLQPEARGIGLVPQDGQLFPHLTVQANLEYGLRRRPRRHLDPSAVIEILELGPLLRRSPATLSGGEKQRTALGRAVLRGPDLLLMDEPVAALDEHIKDRILTHLEKVFREWRIPTLFVSHDQADVRRMAEHVVVIEDGRVMDAGAAPGALDRALTGRMKSQSGPVNVLRLDAVRREAGHVEGGIGSQRLHVPGAWIPDPGPIHVQFEAKDVSLARAEVPGISIRNQLHGTVEDIIELEDRVYVRVDVGQPLWAEVTGEAVRELALGRGSAVTCLVKTSALRGMR
jgi:molybdate transport system ATP-binding protein